MAASYGLDPDPWQAGVLDDWLGVDGGRYAASRCGLAVPRQNGKNSALEVREVYGMVALGERFLHTAHEVKTARKAFARLLEFFDNARSYPELAGMVREIRRTNGQEAIVLDNGGSVEFIARSRGSGRGFSVDVLVADEAQELTEDAWAALLPTISASPNPQVILTGTPPPPGAAGEVFTRMRRTGVEGTDPRLAWSEWSCDDDLEAVDIADPAVWAKTNPALSVRLQVATVADEFAVMSRETFARERLGWWQPTDARTAAINPDVWAALADPGAERGSGQSFGVAVAPDHSWSAVAVAWRRPDGLAQVMLAANHEGTAWLPARVEELRSRWGGSVFVDTAARGLVPDVEETSQAMQVQAHNALALAVEGRLLRHGNEAALNYAVKAARWKPSGDSRVLDRKGSADVSPLIAVALALHGLNTAPDNSRGWVLSL